LRGDPLSLPASRGGRRDRAPLLCPGPRHRAAAHDVLALTKTMADRAGAWKQYPYVADWGDPHSFTFPACDGDARELGMQTYFLAAFLRGASPGTRYALITIFPAARVFNRQLRASFFTVALYDCDRRHYGTYTDFDFPTAPDGAAGTKMRTAPDH